MSRAIKKFHERKKKREIGICVVGDGCRSGRGMGIEIR